MTDEIDVFAVPGVDGLFVGDPADFVARRDDLVKQLKKDGDRVTAVAVKALRKPSAVASAVNRIARQDAARVEALLAAGQAVRAAQAKAVQGDDDGALRTTAREWRARIQSLAAAAAQLVGDQYRDAAAATFEAASTDDEIGAALRAGRLTTAAEPTGFGLAGMSDPPDRPPREQPERDAREEERVAAAKARLEAGHVALEKATYRLRRAEQRLDVARQAVEEASAARDVALAARDQAAADVG